MHRFLGWIDQKKVVAYEVTSSMSYENGSICRTAEIAQAESEWMRQNGKRAVSEREEEKNRWALEDHCLSQFYCKFEPDMRHHIEGQR